MGDLKLLGTWPSPFSYRVIWALKLKGIPFEYIEEDLSNKSPLLLQYNPVHKQIPVLVHGDKIICESMIILEYIEETWPHNPLMPADPYERALARFWYKFADEKGAPVWRLFRTTGEELKNAINGTLEMLKTVEEHCLREKKFFVGDSISLVDIAFGGIAGWLEVIEEIIGVKILESNKFPRLTAWIQDFKNAPVIKDNFPDYGEMIDHFSRYKRN